MLIAIAIAEKIQVLARIAQNFHEPKVSLKNLWFLRFLCHLDWHGCIFFLLGHLIYLGYFCFLLFLLLILQEHLENHRELYTILVLPWY